MNTQYFCNSFPKPKMCFYKVFLAINIVALLPSSKTYIISSMVEYALEHSIAFTPTTTCKSKKGEDDSSQHVLHALGNTHIPTA